MAVARVEPTRQGEVHVKSKLDGEVDLMFFDNQTTPDDQHSISGAGKSLTAFLTLNPLTAGAAYIRIFIIY